MTESAEFVVGVHKPGTDPRNLARFYTHDDAAEYIGEILAKKDPKGVPAGHYYLDGPVDDV